MTPHVSLCLAPRRAECCSGAWAAPWAGRAAGCCAAGCAGGRKGCLCQPRLVGTFAGGAGERNLLRFWPWVGVVCPDEDCSPDPLEQGIHAWNASLLFCCSSNLAAIATALPKTPWTQTGASRSSAFSQIRRPH